MSAAVDGARRFRGAHRCPICDGADGDPRGKERRCHGYLSSDGLYAHCTRDEHAGSIAPTDAGTFAHRLRGPCKCGTQHGAADERPSGNTEYVYRDAHGATLYRVVRTPDKRFWQQRPDGRGGWERGRGAAPRVLYRLPELLASGDNLVFIVEGEKDVETLRARGLVATCNPEGAKKWRLVDGAAAALKGRHLVILPDNDDEGRAHAEQVLADVRRTAASVRVLALPGLPHKGDVSDWFAAGGAVNELYKLVAAAPLDEATRNRAEHERIGHDVIDDERPEGGQSENRTPPPVYNRCRDLVAAIVARASEPWVTLRLDDDELVSVRPGGIVTLIGATGRGKTSLALSLCHHHALAHGPAIVWSLELPPDELVARAIGLSAYTGWSAVLRGALPPEHMHDALPERLYVLGRDHGTFAHLAATLDAVRAAHPDEPIVVALDYVQLVGADGDEDIRLRVGAVMRQIDKLARDRRAVVIALSQGSRASSRALSSGEAIGAQTTDAGAEAADIERWSTVTLAIGTHGEPGEDGSVPSELSVGKSRMGGGDRVIPMRYDGLTGRWKVTGEARAASEVRAERTSQREQKQRGTAALAIQALLARAAAPMSATEIRGEIGGTRGVVCAAVRELIEAGTAVRVRGRKRGGVYPVWTPDRAAAAGIEVIPEGGDHE